MYPKKTLLVATEHCNPEIEKSWRDPEKKENNLPPD